MDIYFSKDTSINRIDTYEKKKVAVIKKHKINSVKLFGFELRKEKEFYCPFYTEDENFQAETIEGAFAVFKSYKSTEFDYVLEGVDIYRLPQAIIELSPKGEIKKRFNTNDEMYEYVKELQKKFDLLKI